VDGNREATARATARVREQRLVFGEVAESYDDVRAGYAPELADAVLRYAGQPSRLVEVGAGTGKATAAFVGHGAPITCIEPDPAMAGVLRARFRDADPPVEVVECQFEDWPPPPSGVPLVYCAQAWHWVDPARRWDLAYEALAPGGTVALFGHQYAFVDAPLEAAINEVYARVAPELLDDHSSVMPRAEDHWLHTEICASGRFVEITSMMFHRVVPYPTPRYLTLLGTFSNHRMLPEEQRARLHGGIAKVVDRHGGVVRTALDTVLTMGRRPS
jgi:SAM-dependent methyltransferase